MDERDPDEPRRCRNCYQTDHNMRNCPNYSIEITSLNVQRISFILLSLNPLSIDLLTYLLKECSDGVLYTHTFHLPVGEATVTLLDVEVLWGLRIDGPPVIGVDTYRSIPEWGAICEELIGFSPAIGYFDGQRLKLGCLARALDTELPPNASDAECRQHARIYLLLILGGHLLSDKSGNKVPLLYLPLLRDLKTVGQHSWGSACLVTLYRSLCDATNPVKSAIADPLVLLQLTGLHPEEPYSEDVLASLPAYCTTGRDIWRSVTYPICWDVVEPHLPHRVMRQFGFHQSLPDMRLTDNQAALHSLDRRGMANQDWNTTHRQYIDIWTDRRVHVQDDIVIEDTTYPSNEYVQWYREQTVIYISNSSRFPAFPEGFQGDSARAQYLVSLFPTHF
ncbi:unnamed protein product [Coffea canephora]|uniref:Aminotransferase-like plant mobile domain-containing protein n=1 Tax=Coffea canephora TaxID=49390 RepID=A0A068TX75_COFCA|nr:unnamed protein product [Coffea canephora]